MKMMMIRFCSVRQKFPHSADFQARGARAKWETRKMHLNSNSVWLLLLSNSIHRFASQKLLLLLLLLLWLLAGSDWDIPNSCSDFECGWWPSWRQTWRHKPPLRLCVVLSLRRIAMDAARVSSLIVRQLWGHYDALRLSALAAMAGMSVCRSVAC